MIGMLLCLAVVAAPQEPETATADVDVIRLKIGTELAGRIVRETADYIELEMGEGNVVGLDKGRTVSILRGVG